MLEYLLVLGQIPGTKFQITFIEIVLATYLPMLALIWLKRRQIAKMDRQYFKLLLLRHRAHQDLATIGFMPARSTRHIISTLPRRTFPRPILLLERPTRRAY